MDDINESDCCGNGCANCILDVKPNISNNVDKSGKHNVLEKYTKFLVINKTLLLPQVKDVWVLHFKSKCSNNKHFILDIDPGHHLMMRKVFSDIEKAKNERNETEKERKYLLRPYSPFWWDKVNMEFKILVNFIPNGPMSNYIKNLNINDDVEFRGPIGKFDHHMDKTGDKYLLIISQGVAIAPIIPIIENILNNEYDMTRIVHIACFKDIKHVYFRDTMYNFGKFWNYRAYIYLSNEVCDNVDCIKNFKCMETCFNFKSKLKYKEAVKPFRFTENEFKKIVGNLSSIKENTVITISGNGKFQTYFKELCEASNCTVLNNIYLL